MDHTKLWESALANLELSISGANFSTWFRDIRILRKEDGVVQLGVPNPFVHEWLKDKFHNAVLKALRDTSSDIRALEYVILKESDIKRHQAAAQKQAQNQAQNISLPLGDLYINKEDNLNPRYTFDSFVVGPFNEIAHTAAQAIIKNPGAVYNPFFIYGNTGHGKTHLIQAVGNHIKKTFPHKKVYYLTSEKFGLDYSTALTTGKANEFKEKYRKYDVLIMDDIQFFSSKEKFQEELFHLFNTFHDNNKQFVFSSDKHPNHIPELEDRLRSRFGQGMIVDIPTPDLESRLAIIQAKNVLHNLGLETEAIEFLAKNIESNIREIEGVMNSVVMHFQHKGKAPGILEIKNLIKNTAKPKKNVSIKEIIKAISDYYNIDEESIYDKTRRKEVVKPRQVIMYILREDFNFSYPSIGDKMGGRDHTTVIHSCDKIKEDLKNNSVLVQEIAQIRAITQMK